MTDTEINIAIAKILGWTAPVGWDGHWPQRQHYSIPGCKSVAHGVPPGKKQKNYPCSVGVQDNLEPVPNYTGDLNAMHEAEKLLGEYEREKYTDNICGLTPGEFDGWFSCAHATARQRAEAFLRALGKWKEDA